MNPASSSASLAVRWAVAAAIFFPGGPSDLAAAWSAMSLKQTKMLWPGFPQ